ncbi:unnamed protein product, partial [Symbiodinium sp. CCMP2592]
MRDTKEHRSRALQASWDAAVSCGFEARVDFCGWSTGEHPWLRSSSSAYPETGPPSAAQGGWYTYVESWALDQDFILSSVFEPSEAIRHLHFHFHMHGVDMGRLRLEAFSSVGWTELWSRTGEQGQQWQLAVVVLPPHVKELRFVGTTYDGGWWSDMALDAIGTGLPSVEFDQLACEFLLNACLWQSTGASSWQLAGDADGRWLEASGNSSQASDWVLETAALFNTTEENVLVLEYQLSGSNTVALEVQHQTSANGWQRLQFESGGRSAVWHTAIVAVPPSTLGLRFAANITGEADVVRIDSIHAENILHDWRDIACGFESDFCAWSTSASTWLRHSGATPSSDTGPDEAGKGEWYIYTEASNNENQEFILTSGVFDPSPTSRLLHFFYHMFGEDTGSLRMETLRSSGWTQAWSRIGEQGMQWGAALVTLPQDARAVRFVGTTGNSWQSDMAVDGIAEGLPTVLFRQLSCDFRFDTCLWRSNGSSSWQLVGDANGQWLEASRSGSQAPEWIFETAALLNTTGEKALVFDYQLSGSSTVALEVQHQTSANGWQRLQFESGGRSAVWHTAIVAVPPSTLGLRFAANITGEADVVRIDSLHAENILHDWRDIACGFESDFCAWSTSASTWLRHSGATLSPDTGPDEAGEGEWYIYTEASDNENQEFILTSGVFDPSPTSRLLHFFYHMFGEDTGSLRMETLRSSGWTQAWTRIGEQGMQWGAALVMLPQDARAVRFVATTGNSWQGDMAVDSIAEGLPTVQFRQLSCDFRFDTCLWRSNGSSSWQLVGDANGQWLEASRSGSQAPEWIFETAALLNTTEERVLVFNYQLSGSNTVTLEVQHQTSAFGWQRLLLQSGGRSAVWNGAVVIIPSSTLGLRFVANITGEADVVRIDSINASNVLRDWSDIACGFESDFCAWSTSASTWLRHSGATPSSDTGPDEAGEGEWYIYTEASDNENQEFILTSGVFDPSPTSRLLHFFYHMFGDDTGSLRMETLRSSGWTQAWSRIGEQGMQWGAALVMLPQDARAVRFVATTGNSWQGDMAVDGIAEGLPTVQFRQLSCDFRFDTCLWRSNGSSSWQLVGDANGQWLEASGNSLQSWERVLETAAMLNATEEKILVFDYQLSGSDAVALEVQHRTSADGWQRLQFESGGRSDAWHTGAVTVPVGSVGFRFVANVTGDLDRVKLDSLSAVDATLADARCSFEQDTCKWAGDWQRVSGPSQSPLASMPDAAFHAESYVYVTPLENEAGGKLQVYVLTSPLFPRPGNVSYLEFAFYMFGTGVGKLELWYLKGVRWSLRWSRQSNQGAEWLQAKVRLPSGVEGLRFLKFGGWGTSSKVALDGILAWEGPEANPAEFLSLSSGGYHNCAVLKAQGVLKCWGAGFHGRLGYGSGADVGGASGEMGENLPAVELGEAGVRVTKVACGQWHTCAVLETGVLKCFGSGSDGKLGYGHTRDVGDEPLEMGQHLPAVDLGTGAEVVQVAAGIDHTCALLRGGRVKCFGQGRLLGLGDEPGENRGDEPGEMGSNLTAVDLGTDFEAVQLALGYAHSCALSSQGAVKCWGQGNRLGLGLGDGGVYIGTSPNEMGDALPVVDLGPLPAVQIAAGYLHTCAVLSDGTVKCWGDNGWGQLGHGNLEDAGDQPGEMGTSLPITDMGDGVTVVRIAASSGSYHTCAVLQDANLKCWGWGGSGLLGQGNLESLGDEPYEMGSNLRAVGLGNREVRDVGTGVGHTCVLLSDDTT